MARCLNLGEEEGGGVWGGGGGEGIKTFSFEYCAYLEEPVVFGRCHPT